MTNLNLNWSPYNMPSFDEFLNQEETKNLIKRTLLKKEEILSKWSPIFEKYFSNYRLSEENLLNISTYIEICYKYYDILGQLSNTNYDLTNVIQKLNKDIQSKLDNKRSPIVRKVFNYQTSKVEYELEDGNFVEIDENVNPPKLDIDNSIFPIDFVKLIDPQKYRDMKIDEIL